MLFFKCFSSPFPFDVALSLLTRVGEFKPLAGLNRFKPAEIKCIYANGWYKIRFTWL